jgi:hypothetical protein
MFKLFYINVINMNKIHFLEITTDQIFCIHQIMEKKWEYNETVHKLFIDFTKAYGKN